MDQTMYLSYLTLLEELTGVLESLVDLTREKIQAVRSDDLLKMDQILKQEQALTLSVRGLEQKRARQLEKLGLGKTRLSELAEAYPKELQYRAKQTAERLRSQYDLYHDISKMARTTLECNLHEIEKILAGMGRDPKEGPGYAPDNPEPPRKMKTDFRA